MHSHNYSRSPTGGEFRHKLLATTAIGMLAGDLCAQQIDSDGPSGPLETQHQLEEIVVTAQKREQPIQSAAIAVSAFSGDWMDKAGIKDIVDLALYTPGVVVSNNSSAGRVYVRGVGNNLDFLGSQGAVALHTDGVYQARPWGVYYDFIDVERVEVLRGPQGTIYGRNATGGAVNIISTATTEDLTAKAKISLGNYDEIKLGGTVSSAITENVAGRISFSRKTRDGYTENMVPGLRDLDNEDWWALRGELRIALNDDLEMRVLGNYLSRESTGQAVVPTTDGLAAQLGARSNTDPFVVSHNIDSFFDAQNDGAAVLGTWRIRDGLTFESITAYAQNAISELIDTDGTELDAISFQNREGHKQISQELRLHGIAANDKLDWLAGVFYLDENTSDVGVVFIPAFGFDVPVGGNVDVNALAVFTQGTFALSDRMGITIGLRYSDEQKRVSSQAGGDDQSSWNDWTPHVALDYQVTENAFVYASITKGFKSGGYNVLGTGEVFGPENVWSYEVGGKTDWFADRLRINSAVFYSRYKDQQVNTFTGAGLAGIENAAESTIFGVEVEAFAAPVVALEFGATFSYLNAEFDGYLAADPFLGVVNLSGVRMSNAPEYSVSVFADYSLPMKTQAEIALHVDYLWQDDVKYDVFDNSTTSQSAFGIVNANISYEAPGKNWKLGLWIRNITDERYFTSHAKLNFTPTGIVSWTGKPRTFGLELSYAY